MKGHVIDLSLEQDVRDWTSDFSWTFSFLWRRPSSTANFRNNNMNFGGGESQ